MRPSLSLSCSLYLSLTFLSPSLLTRTALLPLGFTFYMTLCKSLGNCGYGQDTKQPRMPMQAGKDFKWITTARAMVMVMVWATTTATTRTKNNNNFNCNLLAGSGLRHFLACLTAKFNSCLIFSTTLNSCTQRGEKYKKAEE